MSTLNKRVSSTANNQLPRPKVKRRRNVTKKVSKACNHCRKAHVPCDDARPCNRCINKGLATTCVDAPRKTKKYLLEDSNNINSVPMANSTTTTTTASTINPVPLPPLSSSNNTSMPVMLPPLPSQSSNKENDKETEKKSSTPDKTFLSSAADLEYAILGNIIQQDFMSPGNQQFMSPSLSASNSDHEVEYLNYQPLMLQPNPTSSNSTNALLTNNNNNNNNNNSIPHADTTVVNSSNPPTSHSSLFNNGYQRTPSKSPQVQHPNPNPNNMSDLYSTAPRCDATTNQYFIGTMMTIDGIRTFTFPKIVKMISQFKNQNPIEFRSRNKKSAISFSIGILNDQTDDLILSSSTKQPAIEPTTPNSMMKISNLMKTSKIQTPCGLNFEEPSEIYSQIKSPFSYVKPYHDLNVYLRKRFDKSYLISMSKSIAEYRPSFIAGMIRLKEDDLIFAEQCFQRTLLEYDNYISISGTPTLVWRRTSQIAYVGDEFCILTGWSKESLLGKSTFAVEIMDDKSCVDYFQLFSKIAFGDFRGATMTECTLLTPKGESIRTSSIWTLKRDVFGIPMMIIANFLPILT